MSRDALVACAKSLIASGKGLMAMDESNPTCNARFEAHALPRGNGPDPESVC